MGKYSKMLQGDKENSNITRVNNAENRSEQVQKERVINKNAPLDPRADKAVDHRYWEDLLHNTQQLSPQLYYILHGIRCGGGELTLTKTSFRLLPGDWTEDEWAGIRAKDLDPVKEQLVYMMRLTRFGKAIDEELPEGLFDRANQAVGSVEAGKKEEQGRLFE